MLFAIEIAGDSPIIMHSAAGLDTASDVSREINEITKKRGTNRTEADELRLRELECQRSLWLEDGKPNVPHSALRSCIETGAKKLRQGPQVREGLIVQETTFVFDSESYGNTILEWGKNCQFTVPVVVQRSRILRTRAKFDLPWSVNATVYGDDELVDSTKLKTWLDIGRPADRPWRLATGEIRCIWPVFGEVCRDHQRAVTARPAILPLLAA